VSFFLPFFLLLCRVFLPFLDLERTRKPWVFALFFFFGLYVCDIIMNSIYYYPHIINRLIKFLKFS
jgi:hypothetical protein